MMPRSVFTPSASSPRPSILPTTPTAEMTRSTFSVSVLPPFSSMRRGDVVLALVELRHLGVGVDLDALLLEALAGMRGDLVVLDRQDLRQHLDHRHLRAHACGRRRRTRCRWRPSRRRAATSASRPGPSPRNRSRPASCRAPARQHARPRAGRDDDVLGRIVAGAERALRRVLGSRRPRPCPCPGELRRAPDHVDLVLLQQEADAAG